MVTSLFIAMLLTQAAAPSAAAPVPDDARAAIARANAEWLPAMQHQDTKAIVEPYADDAVFVDAAGVSVKGRPAIEQLMRDRFARTGRVLNATLQQDNLVVVGSMIYEWGHAEIDVSGVGGAAPARSIGRYLTVWKRDATGRWRIIRNLSLGN